MGSTTTKWISTSAQYVAQQKKFGWRKVLTERPGCWKALQSLTSAVDWLDSLIAPGALPYTLDCLIGLAR